AGNFSALGFDHRLERDFGLDSLARVELLARINRELGAKLGEAAFAAETPADLLRLIGDAPLYVPATSAVTSAPTLEDFLPPPDDLATLTEVLDWHVRHQPGRIHIHL
ncbi:acyl carrier protein, partial [Arthrospira platensis SPKY2]